MGWLLLVVPTAALVAAAAYDWRQRHRGSGRGWLDIDHEAVHNRVDINAVPYEPARHAGQRDWATYRRRDRHRHR
jgi:hypothetical protein